MEQKKTPTQYPHMDLKTKDTINFLLDKFKYERWTYFAVATVFMMIAIFIIIIGLWYGWTWEKLASSSAPAGVFTFSSYKILAIWKDCVTLAIKSIHNEKQ